MLYSSISLPPWKFHTLVFEKIVCTIAQMSFQLILLPWPTKCWDHRQVSPGPAWGFPIFRFYSLSFREVQNSVSFIACVSIALLMKCHYQMCMTHAPFLFIVDNCVLCLFCSSFLTLVKIDFTHLLLLWSGKLFY